MHRFVSILFTVIGICVLPINNSAAEPGTLRIAKSYPNGGKYNWAGSGTPHEILFKGERILPKGTNGTYCSGFTFTVVMRTAEQNGLLKEKTADEIRRFQKEWYGATGDTEKQAGPAMENLGIGKSIPFDQARAGDFVQFWRGKSGHSAVFLKWIEEGGKKIGFQYRSTQKSMRLSDKCSMNVCTTDNGFTHSWS
jgi:cell wall-associated NlpC family hydrolase